MPARRRDQANEVHRALAHPLRARILQAVAGGDETSPVELADELGESLGVVSYHVRALADAGLLELSGTSFRRGAVKHHYRAAPALGLTVRLQLSADQAEQLTTKIRKLLDTAAKQNSGKGDVELTVVVHRSS